jgi:hypothetical protein
LLAATGLLLAAVDASSRAHAAGAYGPDAGFGVNAAGLGGTALAALEVAPRLRDALGSGGRGLGVEGVALNSPIVSGLAWRSGASSNVDGTDETEFGEWRGRRVDVHVLFVEHDDWAQMTRFLTGSFFRGRVQQSPQPVVSLAMMPRSERKQHAACARGEFNARFQEFGRNLNAAGAGNAVVRLGWEPNLGSGSHPWGIDSRREVQGYKDCFVQLVRALRSTASGIKIEWANARKYRTTVPAMLTYPGDAVVDIWGLHYYDNPPTTSQRAWTTM